MELREIRYFLAVAQEKSITKAAEYLFIAQPSLSRQMQNLEKEIGKPLFVRGSRKIALTETGKLFKKRAEELIALYEKTQSELSAPADDVSGTVYIGGGESHSLITVAEIVCKIQERYPAVKFNFFSGDAAEVIEKLDKGLIDFGILIDYPDTDRYDSVRLPLSDTWGILARKDSLLADKEYVTADDLRSQPLIISMQALDKGSSIYDWFGKDVSDLDIKGKYNLLYNASLLVKAGMGYAIGLDKLIETRSNEELCFIPLQPPVKTHLDVVWKKYGVFSSPAQIFIERLKKATK